MVEKQGDKKKVEIIGVYKGVSNSLCVQILPISNNQKDSIVKGGEASPTLDKLEIYRDGPQTVLDSSHVDLFPILLRC